MATMSDVSLLGGSGWKHTKEKSGWEGDSKAGWKEGDRETQEKQLPQKHRGEVSTLGGVGYIHVAIALKESNLFHVYNYLLTNK